MPVNSHSIGKDLFVTIALPSGPLTLRGLTAFKRKQEITQLNSHKIDGNNEFMNLPKNWSGSFMVDRKDQTIDRYFADFEASYYAGTFQGRVTINETIAEADGTISKYRYTGVQLHLSDGGEYAGDKLVKMSIDWVAAKRIQVA